MAAHDALAAVLPDLLAAAWDEGHADGLHNAHEYREHRKARNPYTTVSESPCAECERLRGVVQTQGVVLDGYLVEVERLRAAEPIVRTVGDLTARHIGQSVRVFEGPFFTLRHLSSFIRGESTDYIELGAEWDDDPDEWEYFDTPLDTPCEVLG